MWMDGALIGFFFHPCAILSWLFFFALSQLALISIFFCNFIFSPPLSQFFLELYFFPHPHPILFYFITFETFPTHPPIAPTTIPSDLFTYIFKLKVDSSPFTYSPINFKCFTFISTHLPNPLSIYLPTNTLSRYVPNPTYMVTPTYMVATPIDPQWLTTMRKE